MIVIERTVDISKPIQTETLRGNEFKLEANAHTFRISVANNGAAVALTGSVSASMLLADGSGLTLGGSLDNGVAVLTLPQAAYGVPGRFMLAIYSVQTGATEAETVKTCIYACVGAVVNTYGEQQYDPGNLIPDAETLAAYIEACQTATAAANTAAGRAETAALTAVTYAEQTGKTDAEKAQARTNIGAASDADVSSLKSAFETYVADRFNTNMPSNWFNPNAITYGELNKNGTITESSNRIYTDYIPVDRNSIIQCFRSSPFTAIYRRHIAVYDSNKNILPTYGSDNSSTGTYTISLLPDPDTPKYVRITVDAEVLTLNAIIVTDGTTPTAYTPYFDPYDDIADDFLTQESKTALDKLKNHELTTTDLVNGYSCALPKGYIFRQTVGLPESWYYASAVSPLTPVSISAGTSYSQRKNDCISFPNDTALNSVNGYTWTVYDSLFALIDSDGQNVPYGMDRHIVAENLQDCSMLVIGDSTVDHDVMTQKMLDYFTSKNHTLTLLGTLGSGENKNEGRAGWKATDYLTNKQYDGVVNPFYNSATQTFDFAYYMTNQGYSVPDFVVLQLGINDLYNYSHTAIEPAWNAVKTMIDSILSYNTGIKILLNLPTAPNSNQARHTVFLPAYVNRVVKYNAYAMNQARALYGQSKVRPTYCHLILDPSTDISDNVHPTATGYEKMAKEVINQVNCWLNNA